MISSQKYKNIPLTAVDAAATLVLPFNQRYTRFCCYLNPTCHRMSHSYVVVFGKL